MDSNTKTAQNKLTRVVKNSARTLTAVTLLTASGAIFATTGQLVLINSLGVVVSGNAGGTASAVKVVVNDATGVCSTTNTLAYGGVLTVKWDDTKTHSATQCTGITSVDVSALPTTSSGVVQYDSTANTTPPATATAPTNFVAPTTAIANLALIITGKTSAAMTNSATSWGSAVGVAPIYLTTNGTISTTGIMGAVGSEGFKASTLMQRYGVRPANDGKLY